MCPLLGPARKGEPLATGEGDGLACTRLRAYVKELTLTVTSCGMPYTAPQHGVWRLKDGITLRPYQCDDLARIFATEPAQLCRGLEQRL